MRKERFFHEDGKLVYHKQTDPNPTLDLVRVARDSNHAPLADSWHVGRLDKHVLEQWVKEAGLTFSDRDAVRDLIRRKLMDGDFAAFRVHEGTF